jgi:hypothetical protein
LASFSFSITINTIYSLSENSGELKSQSTLEADIHSAHKVKVNQKADVKAGLSSCAQAKPLVWPKLLMSQAELQNQEKVDTSWRYDSYSRVPA